MSQVRLKFGIPPASDFQIAGIKHFHTWLLAVFQLRVTSEEHHREAKLIVRGSASP